MPGKDYDYSDHYAVAANFIIKKNVTGKHESFIDFID